MGVFELLPVDLRWRVLCRPAQGAELLLRMPPLLRGEQGLRRRRALVWLVVLLRRLLLLLRVPCLCRLRPRVLRRCPSPSLLPVFMRRRIEIFLLLLRSCCVRCALPVGSGSAGVFDGHDDDDVFLAQLALWICQIGRAHV